MKFKTRVETSPISSTFITLCPCPQGWEKKINANGRPYYFNVTTYQFTSVLPPESDFDMNGLRLPHGWTRESGCYRNVITETSQRATPLYQGELATSYSTAGIWDVVATKPVTSDFQFFESILEDYNDFGRRYDDFGAGAWGIYAGAAMGLGCTIQ